LPPCNTGSLPHVKGNERLLIILFENIISNSINFRSSQPPLIRVAATEDERHHIITVSDNGTGFDNMYHEKIFEMFQRLGNQASSYRGAGLGLSLCRRITEILGGSISADSAIDMGTVDHYPSTQNLKSYRS
jgi:light-regulated signal transduction histidine kinase (bacteriophytochrome)